LKAKDESILAVVALRKALTLEWEKGRELGNHLVLGNTFVLIAAEPHRSRDDEFTAPPLRVTSGKRALAQEIEFQNRVGLSGASGQASGAASQRLSLKPTVDDATPIVSCNLLRRNSRAVQSQTVARTGHRHSLHREPENARPFNNLQSSARTVVLSTMLRS
jgi:hypothetical protein